MVSCQYTKYTKYGETLAISLSDYNCVYYIEDAIGHNGSFYYPSHCRCRQVTVAPIRIGTLFAQPNLDAQPKSASLVLRQLSMKGLTRAERIASRTCGISAPGSC
jgi:hypothetical protein